MAEQPEASNTMAESSSTFFMALGDRSTFPTASEAAKSFRDENISELSNPELSLDAAANGPTYDSRIERGLL